MKSRFFHFLKKFKDRLAHVSDARYAVCLTAVFLAVGAVAALKHEMWRDEIQAWLLARDSPSFIALFRNLKYEGHPGLWYVCLMLLTRITRSPVVMQPFHMLIASASVYLFTRYSPFTRVQKFLFTFGYFSLYEYSVICRNYAIGVLLLCILCVLFRRRYANFLAFGSVLFLLAHTSVHALILTIAIGFALFLEFLSNRRHVLEDETSREWRIWAGFGLIGLGIIASALQINPSQKSGFEFARVWHTGYDANHMKSVVRLLSQAFFPVPEIHTAFWNTNFLDPYPFGARIQIGLSCLLGVWCFFVLVRRPTALLIYLSGTIGLLGLFYTKYFGSIRHHGFLFILFILAVWIQIHCKEAKFFPQAGRFSRMGQKSLNPILTGILFFHLAGGVIAFGMDYKHVFSYGKEAAAFVKENKLQNLPMAVGEKEYAMTSMIGYSEKDSVYYPRRGQFGSFIRWDKIWADVFTDSQAVQKSKALGDATQQDVLIVFSHPLPEDLVSRASLIELKRFTGSIILDEELYLYLIRRKAIRRNLTGLPIPHKPGFPAPRKDKAH